MVRSPIQSSSCKLGFIHNQLIHCSSIGLFAIGISFICPLTSNASSLPVLKTEQAEASAMLLSQGPPVLQMGSQGKPVSELQATLKRLGHYSGSIDGIYGESTAQAVARFQKSVGLQVDGITGSATWNRLYLTVRNLSPTPSEPLIRRPVLQVGSQGNEVSELQAALKLLGYYAGEVDGLYGDSIANAVARFQKDSGLRVDGVTGPETWNRLFPPTPAAQQPNRAVETATASEPCSCPQNAETDRNDSANASTPSPSDTARSQPVTLPILRPGMRGPAIVNLQERLKVLGVFKGGSDGVFGPATEAGVKAVQRNASLNPDGIVGPATWNALLR